MSGAHQRGRKRRSRQVLVGDGKHGPLGAEATVTLPAGRSAVPDSWLVAPPPTARVAAASQCSNPISRAELRRSHARSAARKLSSSRGYYRCFWANNNACASNDFWPKPRDPALVAIGLYPPLRATDEVGQPGAAVHELRPEGARF